jgi:dethiobiotin synthetase
MRGLFVTGTDTGVGKTVVAAAVVSALRASGEPVAAFKPVVTGTDHPPDPLWRRDHELLAAASGQQPEEVAPLAFGAAAAPHRAAEIEQRRIEPAELLAAARRAGYGKTLIVEGVGGLLVPITMGTSVRDFARELSLPLVIVARPGLGTINHTLLTVEAARAVGLRVRAVVMTPWPGDDDMLAASNRDTVARLASVAVRSLPPLGPEGLAAAGHALALWS